MRRQRLVKAAEPLNQRGLTRFQLSQMLEEKTKAFKDVRERLRLVLERKPLILPPIKVDGAFLFLACFVLRSLSMMLLFFGLLGSRLLAIENISS